MTMSGVHKYPTSDYRTGTFDYADIQIGLSAGRQSGWKNRANKGDIIRGNNTGEASKVAIGS